MNVSIRVLLSTVDRFETIIIRAREMFKTQFMEHVFTSTEVKTSYKYAQ